MAETREWFHLRPFTFFLFHGRSPHTGTIAPSTPATEEKLRITLILYPNSKFMKKELKVLLPCDELNHAADISFFSDGTASLGGKENLEVWCKKELFLHTTEKWKEYGNVDDTALQKMYEILCGQSFVDKDSEEGIAVLESVKDADSIFKSVQLPFTKITLQKAEPSEMPTTAKSTVARGDGRNVTAEAPKQQGQKGRSLQGRTGGVPVQQHSPRMAKRLRSSPQRPEREDCSPGSDAQPRKRPKVERILLPNELLDTRLFNPEHLNAEIQRLQSIAKTVPSKFRHRQPRMSQIPDLGRRPSALPLPETDGSVVVEQMIANGELVWWHIEKLAQGELYIAAVREQFFKGLIHAEALFNIENLIPLFADGLNGAGVQTQRLVEKVKEMCTQANEDTKPGEIFEFNVEELLGKRNQPKFCASVRAVKQPFHGTPTTEARHMAYHLREVPVSSRSTNRDMLSYVLSPVQCLSP
jgi:hypothetical protein